MVDSRTVCSPYGGRTLWWEVLMLGGPYDGQSLWWSVLTVGGTYCR